MFILFSSYFANQSPRAGYLKKNALTINLCDRTVKYLTNKTSQNSSPTLRICIYYNHLFMIKLCPHPQQHQPRWHATCRQQCCVGLFRRFATVWTHIKYLLTLCHIYFWLSKNQTKVQATHTHTYTNNFCGNCRSTFKLSRCAWIMHFLHKWWSDDLFLRILCIRCLLNICALSSTHTHTLQFDNNLIIYIPKFGSLQIRTASWFCSLCCTVSLADLRSWLNS